MTRSRAFALALALSLPVLAGCHTGQNAATLNQGTSGNGTQVMGDGIQVDNATLVAGPEALGRAALLATVYNPTATEDQLVSVTVNGVPATMTPEPVSLPPQTAVAIQTGKDAQAEFTGLEVEAGQYVDVTMVFGTAGEEKFQALLVPPTGFYAEAAPDAGRPLAEQAVAAVKEKVKEAVAEKAQSN